MTGSWEGDSRPVQKPPRPANGVRGAGAGTGANAVRQALADAEEFRPAPPPFSDEALALTYAENHADDLRFVAAWGRWFIYSDGCWREDKTLRYFDLSRDVCRAAAEDSGGGKIAQDLTAAKKVAAVVTLARADRRMAATVEQWDSDPWLLNTPGGVVDLRTGRTRPHRQEDYLTKITAVAPGGECPRWHAFLDQITGGDKHLQLYLQRLAGYALTGLTREHAFAFIYGPGGNGKSVFLSTLAGILDSYATTAPVETFIASHTERHPTDLASLRGARLVTAVETESGRRWAESKLKQLTGGDKIAARFMRQDFFEYAPQFKLVVAGNHRPGLRNIDEAIRRRLHLVPFGVVIPENQRDDELLEKLRAEWAGILAWAIEGTLEWVGEGLNPPEAVRKATDDYFATEDSLGQWLADSCFDDHQNMAEPTTTAELFDDWKLWSERGGERPGNVKQFSQALAQRGYERRRHSSGRAGFAVIKLNPARA